MHRAGRGGPVEQTARLAEGDLRLVHKTLMTLPISSTLEVGDESRWHKFATVDNGWLAILAFLTPYGFVMGGERKRVYHHWWGGH